MAELKKNPKIALVHDYLREYGGAERVLEVLHELFPAAPIYTAFVDREALGIHWQKFADWDIRQTWITKIPFYKKLYSPLRILAPHFFESLDLSGYDMVISSSNAYFAKAVRVPNGQHICYCHTPARSLYGYSTMSDWKSNPITRWIGTLMNHYLRVVDFQVAQRVDQFVANSQETKRRIAKFYRRNVVVIYPPVNVPPKLTDQQVSHKLYYLYVNRLAFAKHPEIALEACNQLKLPLKVVGDGQMRARLESSAGSQVEFVGSVDDEQLAKLYAGAKALLYPVEDEDFGMVPVEAMGYGVPVIAHNSGGPKETVIDSKTGVLFDDLSATGLVAAIDRFNKIKFDQKVIHQHATKFSKQNFLDSIKILSNLSKK